jgi:hypothetical protein
MGVLTYLLTEDDETTESGRLFVSRFLLSLMLVGTAGYLVSTTDAIGFLFFGFGQY